MLFQSWTENIFNKALEYFKNEFSLQPTEIVIDWNPNLTFAATNIFSEGTRFKPCSYYFLRYLTERACRLSLFGQGIDLHVHRLLNWLKSLAFKPKIDIVTNFGKIKDYFKKYWSTFQKLFDEFEDLFIEKYFSDYWNCHDYLFDSDSNDEDQSKFDQRREMFLLINKRLEINDVECIDKALKEAEGKGHSGFSEAMANIERIQRCLLSNSDSEMQNSDTNKQNFVFQSKSTSSDQEISIKLSQLGGVKLSNLPEYSIIESIVKDGKDYIKEELSKKYLFPTEVAESK